MSFALVLQRTFTALALGSAGLALHAQTVLPLETRSLYLQAGTDQQSTRAWTLGKAKNSESYNGFHRAYVPDVLKDQE